MAASREPDVLTPEVRRRSSQTLFAVIVVLAQVVRPGGAGAQSAPYHGKVELLAQEDALEAGRIATLGVLVSTERDGLRLTLKKSSLLEKPVSVLKGLLVFSPDRAFEIAAPVLAQR